MLANRPTGRLLVAGIAVVLSVGPAWPEAQAADTAPPDAQDIAVCRKLASPARSALRPASTAVADIDRDGRPERLEIETQGTARLDVAVVQWADGRKVDVESAVDRTGDDETMTSAARWLVNGGRVYVLQYAGWDETHLRYAWRLGADGRERPICRFTPVTRVAFSPRSASDASVCRAISRGQAASVAVRLRDPPTPSPAHDFLAARGTVTGDVRVDFDNSGRLRALQGIAGQSSAGPGCSLRYFDLDPSAPQAGRADLIRMQGLDLADAYPRRTCLDAEPHWLRYGGVTYLETASTTWARPASVRAEYRWIDAIVGGAPRRVCEARYTHDPPRLTGVWRGGWTRP